MELIQMADLAGQYMKIKEEIDSSILDVIINSQFINGPQVKEFADQLAAFNRVNKVIPCASGTDALQIAIMALNFKPGDEIILPTFSYVATAEVVALLGLIPVFIDVDPDSFNIDPYLIEDKVTLNTKAIVPVHLFGQCANMELIIELASEFNLEIIEDAAQTIGAEYTFRDGSTKLAGTMGTIGTTSFFPSKNLGCFGDGGALFTNTENLGKKAEIIANHGQVVKFFHDFVGINSRLDTLQAAILLKKLPYLNEYTAKRRMVAAFYDQELGRLSNIKVPYRCEYSSHVFNQYTIRVIDGKRDNLKDYLASRGIPTMVYYPLPLHQQRAYKVFNQKNEIFSVSEELASQVLSLPMHTELDDQQLYYICSNIIKFFN